VKATCKRSEKDIVCNFSRLLLIRIVTSKSESMDSTFGFKGEALASICNSSSVSILSRHKSSENAFEKKIVVLQFLKGCVMNWNVGWSC